MGLRYRIPFRDSNNNSYEVKIFRDDYNGEVVNKWLVEKDEVDTALIEHFVIFETFFGITAHTRDTIENDSIIFFHLGNELFPLRSVLSGAGEELPNNSGIGVDCSDVGNLSGNLLVLGTDAAISVNHNIRFLSVLKQTKVCLATNIMPCFEPKGSPF